MCSHAYAETGEGMPHRNTVRLGSPDLLLGNHYLQFVGPGRVFGGFAVWPADFDGRNLCPLAQAEPESWGIVATSTRRRHEPLPFAAGHRCESRKLAPTPVGLPARPRRRTAATRRPGMPWFSNASTFASFLPTTTSGRASPLRSVTTALLASPGTTNPLSANGTAAKRPFCCPASRHANPAVPAADLAAR